MKNKEQLEWVKTQLGKYPNFSTNDYGTFEPQQSFADCMKNVTRESGAYVVVLEKESSFEVLYIGSSGKFRLNENGLGEIGVRKDGGIYARLVKGKKKKQNRSKQWEIDLREMKEFGLKLHIYWVQTAFDKVDVSINKIPLFVEATLMQSYYEHFKRPPAWNLSF